MMSNIKQRYVDVYKRVLVLDAPLQVNAKCEGTRLRYFALQLMVILFLLHVIVAL